MPTEKYYRNQVHKKLKYTYQQGMDGTASNGTWDTYYERNYTQQMAWIEWKRVTAKNPHKWDLLTKLQEQWGDRAECNGRRCAILIGGPSGIYIFRNMDDYFNAAYFGPMSYAEAAHWITNELLGDKP